MELWIGIMAGGIAAELLLLLLTRRRGYHSLGLWIGIVAAGVMVLHMERTIERALDYDEKGARARFWQGYMIRYLGAALLLALVAVTDIANPLTVFAGMLLVKVAAYAQPWTHRISVRVCGAEPFYREMVPEEEQA